MAQPFDARAFRFVDEPVVLAEDVAYNTGSGSNAGIDRTAFSVSDSGVLVYRTNGGFVGSGIPSQVAWFDRAGKRVQTVAASAVYAGLRLSPDETKLVVRRLCEMLTGQQMYAGETAPETLARVIECEPDLATFISAVVAPKTWSVRATR